MHVGFKMQGKCVFIMEYVGYFSHGMHWITFGVFLQFSGDHSLGQITNGLAHLTHSLGQELNEPSHWLFGPGRGS